MKEIILASASPRRKELLELAGIKFSIKTADVDEKTEPGLTPEATVINLAKQKALAVFQKNRQSIVIGADTVVSIDGKILGKPSDSEEAYSMLQSLSGRTHSVYTGVCIVSHEKTVCFCEKTLVSFYELTREETQAYIATGDCYDKAGAYGIQSKGCVLVKAVDGDYFNVVGLPVARTLRELNNLTEINNHE